MRTYNFDNLYFGPYFMITKEEKDYITYFTSNQYMPNVKRKAKFVGYGIFEKRKTGLVINTQNDKTILKKQTIDSEDTYCMLGLGTRFVDCLELKPLSKFISTQALIKNKLESNELTKYQLNILLENIVKNLKQKAEKEEFSL